MRLISIVCLILCAGCGDDDRRSSGSDAGGATDGGSMDVDGGTIGDAGMPGEDAGMPVDAGANDAGSPPADSGIPCDNTFEPNDMRASAHYLGDVDDDAMFPFSMFSSEIESAGDEDWFSFHVEDTLGGITEPRVEMYGTPGAFDVAICLTFECDSGGGRIGCGSSGDLDPDEECCNTISGGSVVQEVQLYPHCDGFDDSGTVHVHVSPLTRRVPVCDSYTVEWGDF